MTTRVKVSNPGHANWRVRVEVQDRTSAEGFPEEHYKTTEVIELDPGSERDVTIWSTRRVVVSEVPVNEAG